MDWTIYTLLVAGITWVLAYVDIVRLGFKEKTFGMPFIALCFNVTWEFIWALCGFANPNGIPILTYFNLVWFILDFFILVTYIKFGYRYFFPGASKTVFHIWTGLCLLMAVVMQYLYAFEYGTVSGLYISGDGGLYSSGLMIMIISIAYVDMLLRRPTLEGQTLRIWAFRTIGTLFTTITWGIGFESNFILVCGLVCLAFDLLYLYLYLQKHKALQLNASLS